MKVVNYTDFRNNLTENLNEVNDDGEIVIVYRSKGKNVVLLDLEEYNSIQETLYLISTKNNQQRLSDALSDANGGKTLKKKLIKK